MVYVCVWVPSKAVMMLCTLRLARSTRKENLQLTEAYSQCTAFYNLYAPAANVAHIDDEMGLPWAIIYLSLWVSIYPYGYLSIYIGIYFNYRI